MHNQSNFRLLVVRLGAMGDILHALPAVTGLRSAHPEWTIDWVVEPRWRALLEAGNREQGIGNREQESGGSFSRGPAKPLVDAIHLAAVKEWARSPLSWKTVRGIGRLRSALRAGAYDAALDFQGAVRSAAIARLSGARRIIGEQEPREWAARWLFNERVATRGAHVIEQDLELASAMAGDALAAQRPLLPVDLAAEAWCDELFRAGSERVVLINPGAGWGAKRWPPERYAQVARRLVQRGLRVLVNAGPGEEPLARIVAG
ncbi:MAG: glycosyltransferase family 9 protein, partial [Terracidiphilus sp.]